MSHPKIKGIKWMDEEIPDLIAVPISLVNRELQEADIPGLKLEEIPDNTIIDLSKLAALNHWYPKGSDDPSENHCLIDVEGVEKFLVDLPREKMLQAWIYYKRHKR